MYDPLDMRPTPLNTATEAQQAVELTLLWHMSEGGSNTAFRLQPTVGLHAQSQSLCSVVYIMIYEMFLQFNSWHIVGYTFGLIHLLGFIIMAICWKVPSRMTEIKT